LPRSGPDGLGAEPEPPGRRSSRRAGPPVAGTVEAGGSMALEQTLNETLTKAIKEKDSRTADAIRMIKSKIGEPRTAKGFSCMIHDALVLDVIGAYRKQLQKALPEFEKVGERGASHAAQLRFDLEFCERYLPKGMDEAALRALVRERLDGLKIADAKQVGRLVGDVMKTHTGQGDAADVKRSAEERLQG